MADHNTLIGSSGGEIEAGTTLVGGVSHEIESGLALIGGVLREIAFGGNVATITLVNTDTQTGLQDEDHCGIVVDGTKHIVSGKSTKTIQVPIGTQISFWFSDNYWYKYGDSGIWLNGTKVATNTNWSSYKYTVNADVRIETYCYLTTPANKNGYTRTIKIIE